MKKIKELINKILPKKCLEKFPSCTKIKEVLKKNKIVSFGIAAIVLSFGLGYLVRGVFVSAVVNGRPILRFKVVSELEKRYGSGALEGLITEELIRQGARNSGIQVTKEEIAQEVTSIEANLLQQGQTLDQVLEFQNMTRKDLDRQIGLQKMLEKILASEIVVGEEEINQLVEDSKDTYPETMTQDQIRESARQQIYQQKLGNAYQTWIEDQKGLAKINYYVEY